jgi:hypothetical protein
MNIVLTSWLTVVLFFLILSTSQIQAVQKMMVAEAQSLTLTIERYSFLKNDIKTHIYTSNFASSLLFFTAALNMITYLLCIFSIFSSQNQELPDSLSFKVTDVLGYSGLFIKEIVFCVYVIYRSSNINDIHHTLLSTLSTTNWDNEKNINKVNLFIYILIDPIKFEILGITVKKKNTTYAFIAAASFTLVYIGAKVFYFYKILYHG